MIISLKVSEWKKVVKTKKDNKAILNKKAVGKKRKKR